MKTFYTILVSATLIGTLSGCGGESSLSNETIIPNSENLVTEGSTTTPNTDKTKPNSQNTVPKSSTTDNVAPIITLKGDAVVRLTLGSAYIELGATAIDSDDVNYTDGIIIDSASVDTAVEGNYTITYNVEDAAGNAAATVKRTIVVEAEKNPPITREGLMTLIGSLENSIEDHAKKIHDKVKNANTSEITDMSNLFSVLTMNTMIPDLSKWDVSNVTNMSGMFKSVKDSIRGLNQWDVSNVTDMSDMFAFSRFDTPLDKWDVSSVTDMSRMFECDTGEDNFLSNFNQPINNWDVSKVTNMSHMFSGNRRFNQPINDWDVSNVIDMSGMFVSSIFNKPLDKWDVSNVKYMYLMFSNEYRGVLHKIYTQDISMWDVSNVTDVDVKDVNKTFGLIDDNFNPFKKL